MNRFRYNLRWLLKSLMFSHLKLFTALSFELYYSCQNLQEPLFSEQIALGEPFLDSNGSSNDPVSSYSTFRKREKLEL